MFSFKNSCQKQDGSLKRELSRAVPIDGVGGRVGRTVSSRLQILSNRGKILRLK